VWFLALIVRAVAAVALATVALIGLSDVGVVRLGSTGAGMTSCPTCQRTSGSTSTRSRTRS
jgi:hypothetical protein